MTGKSCRESPGSYLKKEIIMDKMNFDFSKKVVMVTGGSRGLGKDIALAMAERGANVAICGRKQENLDKALEDFQQKGLEVMTQIAHVGKSDQIANFFKGVKEKFGRLDILVNNVGMNIFTPSIIEMEEPLWDKIIDLNLKSMFLTCKEAVKLMRNGGHGGKIINISSIGARKSAAGMGGYCIAKAGVEMLTKVLAVELAKEKINVNVVAPGMVKTEFSKPFWSNENFLNEIAKTIPMGRIAEIEEVVGSVLFLASELSDYITGEIITVDGGSMA